MRCINSKKKGFTLIEVIIVMLLVSIIGTSLVMGIVHVVQGMVFTKKNAATVLKGQITITKLVKEFSNISISSVTSAGPTSITFKTVQDGGVSSSSTTVTMSGSEITYTYEGIVGSFVLTDQVSTSGFKLQYYDDYSTIQTTSPDIWQSSRRIIEITLKLTGADGVQSEFKARAKPRNL